MPKSRYDKTVIYPEQRTCYVCGQKLALSRRDIMAVLQSFPVRRARHFTCKPAAKQAT